jgi:NADP-dependent 3-hydroxy acid dehydrogenase YdfG
MTSKLTGTVALVTGASSGIGVYNLTKFGVNGFTEAVRQGITQRHVRVGVLEPGAVDTELGSHNNNEIRSQVLDPFVEQTEIVAAEDIADGVAYMVTRPGHASISGLWIMPTEQT